MRQLATKQYKCWIFTEKLDAKFNGGDKYVESYYAGQITDLEGHNDTDKSKYN